MDVISRALASEIPLPISILSELGRGSLRRSLNNGPPDLNVLQSPALWHKLVLTAINPQVSDKHITAASNALCVFLNSGAASEVVVVRNFVFSQETWFDAFQCAHKAFNDGKTKPALQIMETLCDLFQGMNDQDAASRILNRASLPLIRIILLSSPRSELKKACLMLSYLLRKASILSHVEELVQKCIEAHSFAWMKRLSEHNITHRDVSDIYKDGITSLFFALIFAAVDLDTRTAALKLCSVLCNANHFEGENSNFQILAERVIQLYLERNHGSLGDFAENVLPVIVSNKERFMAFIQPYASSCHEDSSRMSLFLAALKVGRAKNILSEPETVCVLNAAFRSSAASLTDEEDYYYWFRFVLKVADPEVRILTYGLLVSSPATNAIVPAGALDCISSSLKYLHDDADAHERGEILSITKRLLRRIQTSALALRRSTSSNQSGNVHDTILIHYKSFTGTLCTFLKQELGPGISYQRHILSLLCLQHFLDLTTEPDALMNDLELVVALTGLVLDPFEDVRSVTANLLHLLAAKGQERVRQVISQGLVNKVALLAVTSVRGDHADALGRLWALYYSFFDSAVSSQAVGDPVGNSALPHLLTQLEEYTSEIVNLRPGSTFPIHGFLLAISYGLREPKTQRAVRSFVDSMMVHQVCLQVWTHVRIHLCVDSPETSTEPEDEDSSEGPKDLLAYSWRALRDSSLVMQSLLIAAPPDNDLYSAIGDICMDQLVSLRHRGAFSTVAQTFSLCCEKVRSASEPTLHELIHKWYKVAIEQIDEQSDRLTRRSAGLPAMMIALLTPADPNFFSTAMSDLMSVARTPVRGGSPAEMRELKLPQVHALNCLKEIMTNSRFSIIVVQFLNKVLELAAASLSSKVWAVRNCGLMLIKACINRLSLTTTTEAIVTRERHNKNTIDDTPSAIALRLLESAAHRSGATPNSHITATEHVFAALDLLGHVQSDQSKSDETLKMIGSQLSHSTWPVRDHAALLLAKKLSHLSPELATTKLLEEVGLVGLENQAHGVLLCCRYVMVTTKGTMTQPALASIIDALERAIGHANRGPYSRSPYVNAAWLDILNEAAALVIDNGWEIGVFKTRAETEYAFSTEDITSFHHPYVLRRILLHKIYHYVFRTSFSSATSKTEKSLVGDSITDPDSLSFALDVLKQKQSHRLHQPLATFLIRLIDEGYRELSFQPDLLEQVFTCLMQSLEHARDIPRERLQLISDRIEFSQLLTPRGMRNAALKLQATLLSKTQTDQDEIDPAEPRIEEWVRGVEYASMDYLDFPTRASAATAISTYAVHMRRSDGTANDKLFRLRLLLTLYDLLNDDDEEVRLEAVHAARKLRLNKVDAMDNLGHCALAAREMLLGKLQREYGQTKELAEAIMIKMMQVGQNADLSPCSFGLVAPFEATVASKLHKISKAKTDLFAEERQNLYIDDVREIRTFTEMLRGGLHSGLTQDHLGAAVKWTMEGLDQMLGMLDAQCRSRHPVQLVRDSGKRDVITPSKPLRESLFAHPLGLTYDHEIMVVFVQVVSLAGVLLRVEQKDIIPLEELRYKLERAWALCLELESNKIVTGVVEHALAAE